MNEAQLTTFSTLISILGPTTLLFLLVRWSGGGSWGISTAIARGLIGWTGRNGTIAGEWPAEAGAPSLDALPDVPAHSEPTAELEDLGSRRIDR